MKIFSASFAKSRCKCNANFIPVIVIICDINLRFFECINQLLHTGKIGLLMMTFAAFPSTSGNGGNGGKRLFGFLIFYPIEWIKFNFSYHHSYIFLFDLPRDWS